MKKWVLAVAVVVALAGCGDGGGAEPETAKGPQASAPAGESEECLASVDAWISLYEALAEATTLDDPTHEQVEKVLDDSQEQIKFMQDSCSAGVSEAAEGAHRGLVRVGAAITACEFVEMCGSQVDDALDEAMDAVDTVRTKVEEGSSGE